MPAYHDNRGVVRLDQEGKVLFTEVRLNSKSNLAVAVLSVRPRTGGKRQTFCVPFMLAKDKFVVFQQLLTRQERSYRRRVGVKKITWLKEPILAKLQERVGYTFFLLKDQQIG